MAHDALAQRDKYQVIEREEEEYAEAGKDGHARDGELKTTDVCVLCVCLLYR